MKKTILLILILILIIPSIMAYVCQDDTQEQYLPCEVVTPSIVGTCDVGGYNSTIIYLNDTSINQTLNMTPIGDGTYNYTFNYSIVGSYVITICDNSTSTLNVIYDYTSEEMYYWIYLVIFVFVFVLFIAGTQLEDPVFPMIGGMLLVMSALNLYINGYPTIDDSIFINWIAIIIAGVGIYFLLKNALELAMGGFRK